MSTLTQPQGPEAERTTQAGEIPAVVQGRLVRCSECVYWQVGENRYNQAINPVTGDDWTSEEERKMWFPYDVRYCRHPKVLFYQRPAKDGAAVFDGSEYSAYLVTGRDFGCVNGEPISLPNIDQVEARRE